jgi:hypothetical protein
MQCAVKRIIKAGCTVLQSVVMRLHAKFGPAGNMQVVYLLFVRHCLVPCSGASSSLWSCQAWVATALLAW